VTNQIKIIILLQIQVEKFILGLLECLILQNIRTKQENKDIFLGTRIMKCELNQVLTLPAFGLAGCFGISQPLKKVMMTLNSVFFKTTCLLIYI
jgi:hypothetical protein